MSMIFFISGRSDATQQVNNFSNVEADLEQESEWLKWVIEEPAQNLDMGPETSIDLPECCSNNTCNIDENLHHQTVLEYISGYILKRFKCDPGQSQWINKVSKGGLRLPSNSFQEAINKLELVFKECNGCKGIYRGKDYINYHVNMTDHVDLYTN